MSRLAVVQKLSNEANELAIRWNKTKEPSIRDQWYKKVKEISQHIPKEKVDKTDENPILTYVKRKELL
jgi:hypothetical protein|tara:strand:- start:288 stop:491 length:204 start_codon:yes stop_codon:yes gene_type:complete